MKKTWDYPESIVRRVTDDRPEPKPKANVMPNRLHPRTSGYKVHTDENFRNLRFKHGSE